MRYGTTRTGCSRRACHAEQVALVARSNSPNSALSVHLNDRRASHPLVFAFPFPTNNRVSTLARLLFARFLPVLVVRHPAKALERLAVDFGDWPVQHVERWTVLRRFKDYIAAMR